MSGRRRVSGALHGTEGNDRHPVGPAAPAYGLVMLLSSRKTAIAVSNSGVMIAVP